MDFYQASVNFYGSLFILCLILSVFIVLIWLLLYIFKEKNVLSDYYFYKIIRKMTLPIILLIILCFVFLLFKR